MNRVGIDIGSTTVKIAILDESNHIIFSAYERHFANIQETLKNIKYKKIINETIKTTKKKNQQPTTQRSPTLRGLGIPP